MKALNVLKYVGFGILGVGLIIGVIFGVQALWNWLIPELFNGPVLTYWQTLGLFFLSTTAECADWKLISESKYDASIFVDTESILGL